ncbi:PAS domain S-box protein [Chloroflexota bacterium]
MKQEKSVRKRLKRVNLVLRTLHGVDQVILEETDRGLMIKGVCDSLVATRGYYNAWIALTDNRGRLISAAESGLGELFASLIDNIKNGGFSTCGQQALIQNSAIVINNPEFTCKDCPLSTGYRGRGGIAVRLYYQRRLYGLLCASVPSSIVEEKEERSLFEQIARDVAFALHKTYLEDERKWAEIALKRSEKRYHALFDSASDAIIVRKMDGSIIMANQAMADLSGYPLEELTRMNALGLLTPLSQDIAPGGRRKFDSSSPHRYELRLIKKDGTEKIIDVVANIFEEHTGPVIQAIARDVTAQKRAQDNLRYYASQAIIAQEEERKRIARELHDETAQSLASLGMDIGSLTKADKQLSQDIRRKLETLRKKTDGILRGVRTLSKALRPPMLEEFGLIAALKSLLLEGIDHQQLERGFDVQGNIVRLAPDIEIALYRIAQEALSNVRKYAEATSCSVVMIYKPEIVELRVEDNGRGFELPENTNDLAISGKLGLAGMQERAKLVGGNLTIQSSPGEGTIIRLELPLNDANTAGKY